MRQFVLKTLEILKNSFANFSHNSVPESRMFVFIIVEILEREST